MVFDGDRDVEGKRSVQEEESNIKKNKAILALCDCTDDYPDGYLHERYFGFQRMLEDSLDIGEVGKNTKGLKLFRRFKDAVNSGTPVPKWIPLLANKIDQLPSEAKSVLIAPNNEPVIPRVDMNDIPF